ncbi:MAG: hypothetical protein KDD50_15780, partial [Bdellovibrionales bacterium]|nr:hypothetical protein [Bdellovibrionales bacterium]
HRVEFDILPDNGVTDGGVAFQLKYKGQIYSQKGVASGFSNTDQFTNDDLVCCGSWPPSWKTDDNTFEAWINDMRNSFNKFIIDKPGWETEDGQHIKVTKTMVNNMPGFSGGGFIIRYRNDLGKIPMDLLHVKGELGTDCSADNGGKPCLEFVGNRPNNKLYQMAVGAPTTARLYWQTLPDNAGGTFLNNYGGPDVSGPRAYNEGLDTNNDMAGLDGTLIQQYNPTNGKWDCLLIDVWNDGKDRNNKSIPSPTTAPTPCDGVIRKYTGGGLLPVGGNWPTDGWTIENNLINIFENGANPFEADSNWWDSAGAHITLDYNNDGAIPCPKINIVNSGTGLWSSPSGGNNQSNLVFNCTVGSPGGKQWVKIRVYQENGGYLSNAQYYKSNNYFTKYYFGGYGGRSPRGGSGGINDFDNLGTPPSVPGGGGTGKMLEGCQSELWYDDNFSGTVDSADFYSYSCTLGGDHKYDANKAMRGAPGKVLIYY